MFYINLQSPTTTASKTAGQLWPSHSGILAQPCHGKHPMPRAFQLRPSILHELSLVRHRENIFRTLDRLNPHHFHEDFLVSLVVGRQPRAITPTQSAKAHPA
jgi:hypothetical protein